MVAEPRGVVETPASTDVRANPSGRRDGNLGGARQEALDREISKGMHGIEKGAAATIRTDGGADGGGVRGTEPALEKQRAGKDARAYNNQPDAGFVSNSNHRGFQLSESLTCLAGRLGFETRPSRVH
ncbi:hypothetical protein THAOC_27688 [Thalassiosira oceanica]|uniref:Uncharacterized protein n=1 Tax=Thalassiosira oceanica TaxID=159749 RepID=K0RGU8_THAOC|nr:hypothetical protein THAOC_27688 [Thalassiosira oceanica]|eukprot:EJK52963.1 hypothetical protein THAOC_27688 [Thalassiosira oceanica]